MIIMGNDWMNENHQNYYSSKKWKEQWNQRFETAKEIVRIIKDWLNYHF